MTAPQTAICTRALSFAYDPEGAAVLRDIDLALPAGVPTALLGANGCGKTTLLRLLLGINRPATGEIELLGTPLGKMSRRARAQTIGWVPQSEQIPFDFSLLDYVLLGRAPYLSPLALPTADDVAIAHKALVSVGLAALEGRPVTQLSGGEQQLGAIARVLAQAPKIILLDEPTSHLDLANRRTVLDVLRALAASGTTLVFTTHDPSLAAELAQYVVLLRRGERPVAGPAEALLTSEHLTATFSTPVTVTDNPGRPVILA